MVVFTGKRNTKCASPSSRRELSLAFGGQIESFMTDKLVAKIVAQLWLKNVTKNVRQFIARFWQDTAYIAVAASTPISDMCLALVGKGPLVILDVVMAHTSPFQTGSRFSTRRFYCINRNIETNSPQKENLSFYCSLSIPFLHYHYIHHSMAQEIVPARSIIGSFYSNLLKLDTKNLNTIAIEEYLKWERRLIDAERKRRKSSGNTAPTKAEKSRILSIGEGLAENSPVATKNRNPKPISWSLYPELFGSVDLHLKKPFTFYNVDDDGLHALKEYDTFVSGVFLCSERCSTSPNAEYCWRCAAKMMRPLPRSLLKSILKWCCAWQILRCL